MRAIRRKTREQLRHERACVLQQLGSPTADAVRQDIEANKERAAKLRAAVREGGGHRDEDLGLVTKRPGAGGAAVDSCRYCNDQGGCWYCGRG